MIVRSYNPVEGGTISLHGAGYAAGHVFNEAPSTHLPAQALRALARNCDASATLHVAIFARASGLDPAEVRRLRAEEVTLDAAEALYRGFVHEIVGWAVSTADHPAINHREI